MNGKDEISGWLLVRAETLPVDLEHWRKKAEALCRYVQHVMSFASSVKIGCPVSEFFHAGLIAVEAYSQKGQQKSVFPVFHWLSLQEIFGCSVKSHFEKAFEVKNLYFAIQWFNMHGAYREANLISSMTVLENLIDSNLTEADTLILPKSKFEKLRKQLSNEIKKHAQQWSSNVEEQAAYVRELNSRLSDLKRRSLMDKIGLLAIRWGVKLDDISAASIREAKTARDQIVHRGYYQSKSGTTSDLHNHVLTIRELVVRFILTALQFDGSYLSYVGRYHTRTFTKNNPNLEYVASVPML